MAALSCTSNASRHSVVHKEAGPLFFPTVGRRQEPEPAGPALSEGHLQAVGVGACRMVSCELMQASQFES